MRTQLTFFTLLLLAIISTLAFQDVSAQPSFSPVEVRLSNANPLTTPVPAQLPAQPNPGGPPLSLTISMLCFCFMLLLIIGVFVLGVVVRNQNRKDHVDD
ncbi:MAG: hypothetical protein Q8L41_12420 [Anaerolineales bacterium]|nr:hypothetical protein [Anaerolineales bacterium]